MTAVKKFVPVSFRLGEDLRARLKQCAERVGLPERTIAQMAIRETLKKL